MPGQPFGNAVHSGIDNSVVNIELIQNISEVPAQISMDNIFNGVLRIVIQKLFQVSNSFGKNGKKGILVYDPLVKGWEFNDHK